MADQVPHHHRVGIGYYPVIPDTAPIAPLPPLTGFWPGHPISSSPFAIIPGLPPVFCPAAPIGFQIPEAHTATRTPAASGWGWSSHGWPSRERPLAAAAAAPALTSDDDTPGRSLPGGLRKGHGYLYTGDPCHVNVISRNSISLKRLLGAKFEEFDFKAWNVSSHTTMNNLIEMLEKKAQGLALTWVREEGDGVWRKVETFRYKGDKGGNTLGSHGWGKAGDNHRTQIWVIVEKA